MTTRHYHARDYEVRAFLAGGKTALAVPIKGTDGAFEVRTKGNGWFFAMPDDNTGQIGVFIKQLPFAPGDLIVVKEAWAYDCLLPSGIRYAATDDIHELRRKRSATTMLRWASRITLRVTDVRVCRVQDVTEDEARACGVERDPETDAWWGASGRGVGGTTRRYMPASLALADLLADGKDHGAEVYERNPWIAYGTVKVHLCNVKEIDHAGN